MLHNIVAVESELNRLDISQSTLSALTEIPAGSLSDILRSVKKPSFEQEQAIYKWLEGLNKLIEAVKPLQLDFKKILPLKQQIELLGAGKFHISIFIEDSSIKKPKGYWVRFRNGSFFSHRERSTGKPLCQFNVIAGLPLFTEEAAGQLIAALDTSGYPGARAEEKVSANQDEILDFIDGVWFEK
jgi:hypothetical protein